MQVTPADLSSAGRNEVVSASLSNDDVLITIIISHVAFNISFVAVVVRARLAYFDISLEEAARDLYANEWQTFRRVTLPLIMPGILGGALLAYSGFAAGFARYGLHVVAAFDNDERKIGRTVAGVTVRPMRGMASFVRRRDIRLAIVTVPADVAQKMADRLVSAGVVAYLTNRPYADVIPTLLKLKELNKYLAVVTSGISIKQ